MRIHCYPIQQHSRVTHDGAESTSSGSGHQLLDSTSPGSPESRLPRHVDGASSPKNRRLDSWLPQQEVAAPSNAASSQDAWIPRLGRPANIWIPPRGELDPSQGARPSHNIWLLPGEEAPSRLGTPSPSNWIPPWERASPPSTEAEPSRNIWLLPEDEGPRVGTATSHNIWIPPREQVAPHLEGTQAPSSNIWLLPEAPIPPPPPRLDAPSSSVWLPHWGRITPQSPSHNIWLPLGEEVPPPPRLCTPPDIWIPPWERVSRVTPDNIWLPLGGPGVLDTGPWLQSPESIPHGEASPRLQDTLMASPVGAPFSHIPSSPFISHGGRSSHIEDSPVSPAGEPYDLPGSGGDPTRTVAAESAPPSKTPQRQAGLNKPLQRLSTAVTGRSPSCRSPLNTAGSSCTGRELKEPSEREVSPHQTLPVVEDQVQTAAGLQATVDSEAPGTSAPIASDSLAQRTPRMVSPDEGTCPVCSETFEGKSDIIEHFIKTRPPKHKCKTCKLTFKSSLGLRVHERRHRDDDLYRCTLCKKHFSCKKARLVHQISKLCCHSRR